MRLQRDRCGLQPRDHTPTHILQEHWLLRLQDRSEANKAGQDSVIDRSLHCVRPIRGKVKEAHTMMTETSGRRRFAFATVLMAGILMILPAAKTNAEGGARIKAGNQLIVAPGFRLKIAPGGKTARIYRPGGEGSIEYSCHCDAFAEPHGECSLKVISPAHAVCKGDNCGRCNLKSSIPMKQKSGSRRLEQWPSRMRASTMGFRSQWMAKVNEPTTCSSSGHDDH
jgi:hypothetical protein